MARDFPGWTRVQGSPVAAADQTVPVSGGQLRQERAVVMQSPDGQTRLLVTYMRSAKGTASIGTRPWRTLDRVFIRGGWQNAAVQSLYRAYAHDFPGELVLGAYDVGPAPGEARRVNVGFYAQTASGSTYQWVRGERVYSVMSANDTWRCVAQDSHSGSYWDALTPVE